MLELAALVFTMLKPSPVRLSSAQRTELSDQKNVEKNSVSTMNARHGYHTCVLSETKLKMNVKDASRKYNINIKISTN